MFQNYLTIHSISPIKSIVSKKPSKSSDIIILDKEEEIPLTFKVENDDGYNTPVEDETLFQGKYL